jgi:hypothetical protein
MWTSNLDKVLDQVTGADCQQAAEELERYLDAGLTATRESGLKGFRRAAARAIFSQARVDGIRRRDAVARPPARAGGRGGRRPSHGPPRQQGADADRRPEDARRGLDPPAGGPGGADSSRSQLPICAACRHRRACRSIASSAANHGGLLVHPADARHGGLSVIPGRPSGHRDRGIPATTRQRLVASKLHVSAKPLFSRRK